MKLTPSVYAVICRTFPELRILPFRFPLTRTEDHHCTTQFLYEDEIKNVINRGKLINILFRADTPGTVQTQEASGLIDRAREILRMSHKHDKQVPPSRRQIIVEYSNGDEENLDVE
jgi:hypothetical protein